MPKAAVFFVTPELRQLLDNLADDEPRSRLEPFRAFILRWRREGRTYRRIQSILKNECRVSVSISTLFNYVERRSRPRKTKPEIELEQVLTEVALAPLPEQATVSKSFTNLSPEDALQKRVGLQSFRNKPALAPKPPVLQEFHYDEDKPLTIDRTIKD